MFAEQFPVFKKQFKNSLQKEGGAPNKYFKVDYNMQMFS
jgi:hypothetical protein